MATRTRLPLIAENEELSGSAPVAFERALRSAPVGSPTHRELVSLVLGPVREVVSASIPPSAASLLAPGLDAIQGWVSRAADEQALRLARKNAFAALSLIEGATVEAIQKAQALEAGASTELDRHADHVVLRYASLAAHFATSAVCHTLDAGEAPPLLLEALRDVVGAHAYRKTGLGAARDPAFRARSLEQAQWEAARPSSRSLHHEANALAPQIFHEYLGARWRAVAASERALLDGSLEEAMAQPRAFEN